MFIKFHQICISDISCVNVYLLRICTLCHFFIFAEACYGLFYVWSVDFTQQLNALVNCTICCCDLIFTVRRYALHGLSYRNSVCSSVCLSVCLSVRPSVILVDCVHMFRRMIMISSPYGSPIILVSGDITLFPKFEGGHPERGH